MSTRRRILFDSPDGSTGRQTELNAVFVPVGAVSRAREAIRVIIHGFYSDLLVYFKP